MTLDDLTERQRMLLIDLAWKRAKSGAGYWKAMDLGGTTRSHHSRTLSQLIRKGLVKDGSDRALGKLNRLYQITDAGMRLVEDKRLRRIPAFRRLQRRATP